MIGAGWRKREAGRRDEVAFLGRCQHHYRAIDPWRVPVSSGMRSLLVGVVISLVFVASAQGSCTPHPTTGLWEGGFANYAAEGEWLDFLEVTEESPGLWALHGEPHASGSSKIGGGPIELNGVFERATINCQGEFNGEILWTGIIEGTPVTEDPFHFTGTFNAIAGSGEWYGSVPGFIGPTNGQWWTTQLPSAPSQGTQPGDVGIVAPPGTQASSFTAVPIDPSQLPSGVVAPVGALAFTVTAVPAYGTISVTLVLPPGSGPTAVYKSANGVYEPYPAAKTQIHGNEITLELTDNEAPWDQDSEPGVITDPVVPVEPQIGTPPTIAGLSPKKAAARAPVTITGRGFGGATVIRFGTKEAASFQVVSPSIIKATTPSGVTGKVRVSVASRGGVSASTKKDLFTFKKVKKPKK